jgi:hypothetical protein
MDMFRSPPRQPSRSAAASHGRCGSGRDDWIYRLGEGDVAEIDEAVRLTRTRGLAIRTSAATTFRSAA